MKYFRQFGIIMLVTCIAESVKYFVDFPIPSSVYGLCIMMFCLMTKIVKLGAVEDAAVFLIEIMPVPVLVITPVSTVVVMVVSGRITQRLLGREKK